MEEDSKKLSKSAKFLMINNIIFAITSVFVDTFLVAYFLKVTNDSIVQISLYYIIIFLLKGIGNIIIGKYLKNKAFSKVKILSIGIVLRALFLLFIVVLKEKIATYFPIVAILYGISDVFYWVVHVVISVEVTTNDNRKNYVSIDKILGKITYMLTPIILGITIQVYSFTQIAFYVFVLSVIQIVIASRIILNDKANNTQEKYSISNFIKTLNDKQKRAINKFTLASMAYGVLEYSIKTLVVIVTIMTLKTSINLGILTSIFSIFSMITLYLYKKFYTNSFNLSL